MPGGVPALHPERKGALNLSPKKNWVEDAGGLPTYIESIAVALVRQGFTRSHAIATAVNQVRKICATGRAVNLKGKPKVSPAVRAAACKAAADWERKKAQAKAS